MNKKKVKVITQKYWNLTAEMKVSTLGGNLCLHLCHLNKEITIIAVVFVFIFSHELIFNLIQAIMVGKNQQSKPSLNGLIMAIVNSSPSKPSSQSIKNILSCLVSFCLIMQTSERKLDARHSGWLLSQFTRLGEQQCSCNCSWKYSLSLGWFKWLYFRTSHYWWWRWPCHKC